MLYKLFGLIFGEITRDYGGGFEVTTFVGALPFRHLAPSGYVPPAINDNAVAA